MLALLAAPSLHLRRCPRQIERIGTIEGITGIMSLVLGDHGPAPIRIDPLMSHFKGVLNYKWAWYSLLVYTLKLGTLVVVHF